MGDKVYAEVAGIDLHMGPVVEVALRVQVSEIELSSRSIADIFKKAV